MQKNSLTLIVSVLLFDHFIQIFLKMLPNFFIPIFCYYNYENMCWDISIFFYYLSSLSFSFSCYLSTFLTCYLSLSLSLSLSAPPFLSSSLFVSLFLSFSNKEFFPIAMLKSYVLSYNCYPCLISFY